MIKVDKDHDGGAADENLIDETAHEIDIHHHQAVVESFSEVNGQSKNVQDEQIKEPRNRQLR